MISTRLPLSAAFKERSSPFVRIRHAVEAVEAAEVAHNGFVQPSKMHAHAQQLVLLD